MSVSLEKGISRLKGLSIFKGEGDFGESAPEIEIGDFILYEDDTSILLESIGSSFVAEVDPQLYILMEDTGDPIVLETLTPLETE